MRVTVMSDTHLPRRARDLPPELWKAVDDADVVIHAGDWVSADLLDQLEGRSKRLIGCFGNNDGDDIRARLPEIAETTLEGVRISVIHETGAAQGRETRCAIQFPDTDLLIFGHSHIPWDSVASTGLRLLNPGSPTDRRRQPFGTYHTLELRDSGIHSVKLHSLPTRKVER